MVSNIYAFIRFVPLVLSLTVAIVGAFAALIGGLAGWGEVTEFGKWLQAAELWDFFSGSFSRL